MNSELKKVLQSTVCECESKISLINDYLERFKISDVRITAPIWDVERCVGVMKHILGDHEHNSDESERAGIF